MFCKNSVSTSASRLRIFQHVYSILQLISLHDPVEPHFTYHRHLLPVHSLFELYLRNNYQILIQVLHQQKIVYAHPRI